MKMECYILTAVQVYYKGGGLMRGYMLTFATGDKKFIAAYSVDWSSDRVITLEAHNEQNVYYGVVDCKEIQEDVSND